MLDFNHGAYAGSTFDEFDVADLSDSMEPESFMIVDDTVAQAGPLTYFVERGLAKSWTYDDGDTDDVLSDHIVVHSSSAALVI